MNHVALKSLYLMSNPELYSHLTSMCNGCLQDASGKCFYFGKKNTEGKKKASLAPFPLFFFLFSTDRSVKM